MRKFLIDSKGSINGLNARIYEVYPGDGSMQYSVELYQRGVLIDMAGPFDFQVDAEARSRVMVAPPLEATA